MPTQYVKYILWWDYSVWVLVVEGFRDAGEQVHEGGIAPLPFHKVGNGDSM